MKKVSLIIVAVVLGLFFTTFGSLPKIGDPNSAPNTHVTPHYIEHSHEETGSPNIVTATLADYRGFDTLEETTVMFLAGMTAILILRAEGKENPTLRIGGKPHGDDTDEDDDEDTSSTASGPPSPQGEGKAQSADRGGRGDEVAATEQSLPLEGKVSGDSLTDEVSAKAQSTAKEAEQ